MRSQPLYLIPGPIELDPAVVAAMTYGPANHSDPEHTRIMHSTIEPLRAIAGAKEGLCIAQPGSGSAAMDGVACNMIEPGDEVLMIQSGFFSRRFEEILRWYGAKLTIIDPPIGVRATAKEVEAELKKKKFKFIYVTHVETSTSISNDMEFFGKMGKKYGAMVVVDAVCSLGAEEMKMDEWGIDLIASCSQKALAAPPGLAITIANPRAIEVWKNRKTHPAGYYASWNVWMGPSRGYEQSKFVLHSTPPVQVINAFAVSLQQIMAEGVDNRVKRHRLMAQAVRAGLKALGLKLTVENDKHAAVTVTAPFVPEGMDCKKLLAECKKRGVVFAGGLYNELCDKHIRFGHMGTTTPNEIYAGFAALEDSLEALGYKCPASGLEAAREVFKKA